MDDYDLSQEAYDDAVIEDTVHCKTCGASMLCGDNDCYVVGTGAYCPDHVQDAISNEELRLHQALAKIADMDGCECDGYHGHTCLMCRVRAIARDAIRTQDVGVEVPVQSDGPNQPSSE